MTSALDSSGTSAFDPALVAWLRAPVSYPHAVERVDFVETHISLVALAGEYVYKFKRPIRLPYLDYSTLPLRAAACRREVELNSRLAPAVYLGVRTITRSGATFAWDGAGRIVEYAVQMRRLPAERVLSNLLDRREVRAAEFERLCDVLVEFYRSARRCAEIAAQTTPAALSALIDENVHDAFDIPAELLPRESLERIAAVLRQYLHDHRQVFAQRTRDGAACDAHGDLRAEQIYLTEPPLIIDCVEFSDRLRYVDVASDAAFLANDLNAAGGGELSERLVQRLAELEPRPGFQVAMHWYQVLRGLVRAKVAATAIMQPDLLESERARWRGRLQKDWEQTLKNARAIAEPKLIALCGLPGSGKSTVAQILHETLGMVWLRSDVIRKELAVHAGVSSADLYSAAMTERTYAVLLKRAEAAVADQRSVVLDATFAQRAQRRRAAELAQHLRVPYRLLECVCPERVLRQRLTRRLALADAASDATIRQFDRIRSQFEPLDESSADQRVRIETDRSAAAVRDAVLAAV
ncbi:MAG TPA: AAA family ATPase [Phycisphaerae bacterium]